VKRRSGRGRSRQIGRRGSKTPLPKVCAAFGSSSGEKRALTRGADDFEVSIFLTETNTRHSILFKQKHFRDKEPQRIHSNTNKLIGETNEDPVDVETYDGGAIIRQEESDEEGLADIPVATASVDHGPKRRRNGHDGDDKFDSPDDGTASAIEIGSDTDQPPPKRLRAADGSGSDDEAEDDKKKMAMDMSYEGFAIYGRVLCLVVRKKDHRNPTSASKAASHTAGSRPAGQASMENWITSTQIPVGEEIP
jgi:hypothetical protein